MKRKWALVARGDRGGLATQTRAIASFLKPDAVLLLDLDSNGRSGFTTDGYENLNVKVCRNNRRRYIDENDADWLRDQDIEIVFTIEGWYSNRFVEHLDYLGIERVLYANPELYPGRSEPAERIFTPTSWLVTDVEDRADQAVEVLPWPAIPRVTTTGPPPDRVRFLHVDAPAMMDREGTEILHAAVMNMPIGSVDLTVYDRTHFKRWPRWVKVITELTPTSPLDIGADVLIQPRRYGGLSLLQWEASERGMAILCMNRPPEASMPGRHLMEPSDYAMVKMKAGQIAVYNLTPESLSASIHKLAFDASLVHALKNASLKWAKENTWERHGPLWARAIQGQ